jgi:hypothetical protein
VSDYTLWDGINTATISGDEHNGAGVNAPIDMVWWDAAHVVTPLIVQRSFWDDVDLCVRPENRVTMVRREKTLLCVGDE